MGEPPSILFAISDTGGGHRSGAVALDAALEQLVGSGVQRHIVDMLASTGVPLVRDAPRLYDRLSTKWLPLYNALYQLTDGRYRIDALTHMVYLSAHRNIVRVLEETRPKLVVSVHPLSNRLIGNARRAYRLSFRFVTVVTDLVSLHAAWADPDAELCIVPTHEAYERMLRTGIQEHMLAHTGFPVHPKFAAYTASQRETRFQLGLAPDLFTVMVTSGGVGAGNMRDLVLELTHAYSMLQLVVITGRNAALREELCSLNPGPNVHICGFVDNMEAWMAASDIIVSKAGPGTLMEALVMRKPVIVTEAVGMQERGNIDFVLNHELGAYCPTIDRVVPAIVELMKPDVYAATTERLSGSVPRDGALQIARLLLEQLQLEPPRRKRGLQLPGVDKLRPFSGQRLHWPGRRARARLRLTARVLRGLPKLRRLPSWRRDNQT